MRNRKTRKNSALAIALVLVVTLSSIYIGRHANATSTYTDSPVAGWGATRLQDTVQNSTAPNSAVFLGEKASNFEQIALREATLGYNTIRASFSPYCTAKYDLSTLLGTPPGKNSYHFIGDYDQNQLGRAIKIASYLNFWVVVDYHGYSDLYNSTTQYCWQSAWFGSTVGNSTNGIFGPTGIIGQFKNNYTRIVWEPLNEPTSLQGADDTARTSYLASQYQAWINNARKVGDTHGIVVQNICSFSCNFARSSWWMGYPKVNDTQLRVFESFHTYLYYPAYIEHLAYDDNLNGIFDSGDTGIIGFVGNGATLKIDSKLLFANQTTSETWSSKRAIVYDVNSNGKYDAGDLKIAKANATYPAIGASLKADTKVKFVDSNSDNTWTTYWNNATADGESRKDYLSMLNETAGQPSGTTPSLGWSVLNTEGGPYCGSCETTPDLVIGGSAGYSIVGLHYIQDVTNYMESNNPRLSWMWWPAASWTSTPGAGTYGALSPNINGAGVNLGWGTLLSHQHFSVFASVSSTTQTNSELTIPESEQRTFQNPRGQHGYYVFYRDSINGVQSCYYATSPDGSGWISGLSTGLSNLYDSCSVAYAQDPSNSRTLVYFVASRHSTYVGTNHDIDFRIGSIPDASVSLTWLTNITSNTTVRTSNSTENLGYPTIAQDSSGYLYVAFSYTNDAAGVSSDKQNVEVCSSTTAYPTNATNLFRVCSSPRSNNPFTVESGANITTPIAMPHVLPLSNGILIIKGTCSGAEANFITCSLGSNTTERSAVMTWNGSTQTWGNTASFNFVNTNPRADVRTSAVNATGSYQVHYAYEDGGNLITRYIDSPYTSWSTATTACACNHVYGAHFTHVTGSSLFERFVLFYSTGYVQLYSVNATDSQRWGPVQLEYINGTDPDHDGDCDTGCFDAMYPTSASNVTELSANTQYIPVAWIQASNNRQVWFDKRPLN